MEEDINNEQNNPTSKINSASLVNMTLNELTKDFFRHYRDGKYLAANSDLDCIWTILGGEKGVEGTDTETDYKKIETKLEKLGSLQNNIESKGFQKPDPKQLIKFGEQRKVLMEKSIFLRRLLNEQGKGSAYHQGEEDYMDG